MPEITDIQSERGGRYGTFDSNASTQIALEAIIRSGSSFSKLSPAQVKSLDWCMSKIARIVNGDPAYLDSWVDAESYLNLGRKWTEENGGY